MTSKEKAQIIFNEFVSGSTVYAKTATGELTLESVGIAGNKVIGYVVNDDGLARRLDVTNAEIFKYCPFTICGGVEAEKK